MFHQTPHFEDRGLQHGRGDVAHAGAPHRSTGAFQQATRWLGAELAQRRRLGVAAPVGEGAARREAAALGLLVGAGHRALDRRQPLALDVEARDRAQKADRVGVLRIGEQGIDRRLLDDLAGVHHQHVVGHLGDHAEIVGDDQDRHAEPSLQVLQQVEDLRLDGDVERGGRLVGDQQRGLAAKRHGDHHALAHAARQAVRIVVDPLGGGRNAHQLEHLDGAFPGRLRRHPGVRQDRLDDLLADRMDRVERGHRLLEDHRHRGSAQPAPLVGREAQHVAAVEQHRIGRDLAGRARDQAHHRQRGHALAAARFAHQPHGLAAADGEVDAVDGAEQAAVGMEVGFEAADLEELVHQNE